MDRRHVAIALFVFLTLPTPALAQVAGYPTAEEYAERADASEIAPLFHDHVGYRLLRDGRHRWRGWTRARDHGGTIRFAATRRDQPRESEGCQQLGCYMFCSQWLFSL